MTSLTLELTSLATAVGAVVMATVGKTVELKRKGKYAIVTGATDGIGFGYAMELARQGMAVILVSRSEEKLKEKQAEIKAVYPDSETMTIVADFSAPGANGQLYKMLEEKLGGLEIGVLVNNVGVSYDHADYLTALEFDKIQTIIDVNVNAATFLSRIVLVDMTKRKKGVIINVGSAAGLIPVGDPLYAVYSASKAYVDYFSRSLFYELRDKGIIVQCQVPYFVTSKMSKIRNPSLFTPSAQTYARAALSAVGNGEASVVPYWPHKLQHFAITHLPTFAAAWYVLSHHHSIRSRALKKKAEKESTK